VEPLPGVMEACLPVCALVFFRKTIPLVVACSCEDPDVSFHQMADYSISRHTN
jgi:hypothetical protein